MIGEGATGTVNKIVMFDTKFKAKEKLDNAMETLYESASTGSKNDVILLKAEYRNRMHIRGNKMA